MINIDNFLKNNTFFQNIQNDAGKILIELHTKDYIKAYKINIKEQKKDFLAKYGKGNARRKKLITQNTDIINNSSTQDNEKYLLTMVNDILELLINEDNKKLGLLLISMYFLNKQNIRYIALDKYYYSPIIQEAVKELFEHMDFYSFTYFSKDKIINSLAIVLYGLLVSHMEQDRLESIKFINAVLNTNFEKSDLPTRIRADYLDKYHPYCVGIYNSIPIFQSYTGSKESYYSNKDLEKISQFLKSHLQAEQIHEFINKQTLNYIYEVMNNSEKLLDIINKFHLYYALQPNSSLEHKINQNKYTKLQLFFKNPKITIKSAINYLFSRINTKLTT